ncbi:MAG: ECF transporter S component [Clostridia bacterium]|nr:ECF transporter S component [Clostridia bacterium]
MNKTQKRLDKNSIRKMVMISILGVIIVVLQAVATMISSAGLLPVAFTLALVPILVGSAMYGIGTGTILGTVFGVIVFIIDPTAHFLMGMNFIATAIICIGKGALAGFTAGLVYKLASRLSSLAAIILAGIAVPIVNTGLFVLGMLIFFKDTIIGWSVASGSASFGTYVIFGLCGINFVVELCVNLLLATAIKTIIGQAGKKS